MDPDQRKLLSAFMEAAEAGKGPEGLALLERHPELASLQVRGFPLLHMLLDWAACPELIHGLLERGADINATGGPVDETPLHVAVRRHRSGLMEPLARAGADLDARTRGGMTAYRHAFRRGFSPLLKILARLGAATETTDSDEFAVAVAGRHLDQAARMLAADPALGAPAVPEETRLLPDLAGRPGIEPALAFLLAAGFPLEARGLDSGTSLQVAAWFGQSGAVRLLLDRGADVHTSGDDHDSTPLGWAVHGSRFSGDAARRQAAYVEIVRMLLAAGATPGLPGDPPGSPGCRMRGDATPEITAVLDQHRHP